MVGRYMPLLRGLQRGRRRLADQPSQPGYGWRVPEVELTRAGGVLTITLNRPEVLNALNRAVHAGLAAGLAEAQDPAVRAVVITGAGRGFCVGQDLQEFSGGAGDVAQ